MNTYHTHHLPSRTVRLDGGKEYLWFSGTDYLGMGSHEHFAAYIQEGLAVYGTHFGSSRNNTLQLSVYSEAETALAQYTEAPSSLIVSSGMWAGQILMRQMWEIIQKSASSSDVTYHYAPRVHPALWGKDYTAETLSWKHWAQQVIHRIQNAPQDMAHMICSDSIGSPWVEHFDFSIFENLPPDREIWLIADDSHGLGVTGKNGQGIYRQLAANINAKVIVAASLNKALGINGGAILGEPWLLEKLRASPWFSGCSPTAPAFIFAFCKLLKTNAYVQAYEKLRSNIDYFSEKTSGLNLFESVAQYPVFCSRDATLFGHLHAGGIMASCFSYPSPSDAPVTRLALSAVHQKEDLDRLAEVCMKFDR